MKVTIEEISGLWKLSSWKLNIVDSQKQYDVTNHEKKIKSSKNIWEANTIHSDLYEYIFKGNPSSEDDLKNYILSFVFDKYSQSDCEIEIYNQKSKELYGSIRYAYGDYYEEDDLTYVTDNTKYIAKLQFINKLKGRICQNLPSDLSFEYAMHELIIEKIEDQNTLAIVGEIKRVEIERERNEISPIFGVDKKGNKIQLTNGEFKDFFSQKMIRPKTKKKWWEFWK